MSHEFDEYVDDYAEQHRQSIRLSGEAPDFLEGLCLLDTNQYSFGLLYD